MLRVTQRTMYSTMTDRMNNNLGTYMESQMQGSTLKKVNRPSDDPAGMARILNYRSSIERITQLESSADTALGWLQLADSTLSKTVSTLIGSTIKPLAEQAATDTMSAENRRQVAQQLREALNSLLNLSNTRYEDKTIFAGQDYVESAYELGLTVTAANIVGEKPPLKVTGTLESTVLVRFTTDNPALVPANTEVTLPPNNPADIDYEYSDDGGKTWTKGLVNTTPVQITEPLSEHITAAFEGDFDEAHTWIEFETDLQFGTNRGAGNTFTEMRNQLKWKYYDEQTGTMKDGVPANVSFAYNAGNNALTDVKFDLGNGRTITLTGRRTVTPGPNPFLPPGQTLTVKPASAKLSVGKAATIEIPSGSQMTVKLADPDGPLNETTNGSLLYVRPTAIYQGSDNDATPLVQQYGSVVIPPAVKTSAVGTFNGNTLVRFPSAVDLTTATPLGVDFEYDYSLDGGRTWQLGNKATAMADAATGDKSARLLLPGGYLDLNLDDAVAAPNGTIPANAQLALKPQRTDLSFTIMEGQTIKVNNVGKDIFGGIYRPEYGDDLQAAFGEDDPRNLFETLGRLIGYCETNNRDGIGQCLADLDIAHKNVLTHATAIGGKENRITDTLANLDDNKYDQQTRMSNIEDVNITELMVRLTQQQMAYQTVLQSSSMIMQLNLTKYV